MKKKLIFLLLLLSIAFSCKKNDDSSTEPEEIIPKIQPITFNGPSKTDTDLTYHAIGASSYASSMTAFFQSTTAFAVYPAKKVGDTWQWTITQKNLTINVQAKKDQSGNVQWQSTYNGEDEQGNKFNNALIWKGTLSNDGKIGKLEFYNPETGMLENIFSYSIDSQQKKTGTVEEVDNFGVVINKAVLINNTDGSGSLDTYEFDDNQNKLYKSGHIEWFGNGSGKWYEYDTNGFVTASGSWT